jgi:hypothetical protein
MSFRTWHHELLAKGEEEVFFLPCKAAKQSQQKKCEHIVSG